MSELFPKNKAQDGGVDYIRQLRDQIFEIAKDENISRHRAFIVWILEQYYSLAREEAINAVTDGVGDKRIDAFLEGENDVKVMQCKFFDDETKEVRENDIAAFKGCIDWLKQPDEIEKLHLPPKLFDAATTFVERWNEHADVELHYFAFGRFSSGANHERKIFNNTEDRERMQMYFHDLDDILNSFRANLQVGNPLASERITFSLKERQFFVREGERFPAIIMTIKGKELANLHRIYGKRLFEGNIRFFRGTRKGSINARIVDTVLDKTDRGKFWYFNNGISFVCSDFTFDDSESPTKLTIVGPQVINGCQTTVCLSEARGRMEDAEEIPEEVDILARFIKTSARDDIELITLYTNSQNPVSEAQLKSNDPIQKRLKGGVPLSVEI